MKLKGYGMMRRYPYNLLINAVCSLCCNTKTIIIIIIIILLGVLLLIRTRVVTNKYYWNEW
jgi:hypothetical protein